MEQNKLGMEVISFAVQLSLCHIKRKHFLGVFASVLHSIYSQTCLKTQFSASCLWQSDEIQAC